MIFNINFNLKLLLLTIIVAICHAMNTKHDEKYYSRKRGKKNEIKEGMMGYLIYNQEKLKFEIEQIIDKTPRNKNTNCIYKVSYPEDKYENELLALDLRNKEYMVCGLKKPIFGQFSILDVEDQTPSTSASGSNVSSPIHKYHDSETPPKNIVSSQRVYRDMVGYLEYGQKLLKFKVIDISTEKSNIKDNRMYKVTYPGNESNFVDEWIFLDLQAQTYKALDENTGKPYFGKIWMTQNVKEIVVGMKGEIGKKCYPFEVKLISNNPEKRDGKYFISSPTWRGEFVDFDLESSTYIAYKKGEKGETGVMRWLPTEKNIQNSKPIHFYDVKYVEKPIVDISVLHEKHFMENPKESIKFRAGGIKQTRDEEYEYLEDECMKITKVNSLMGKKLLQTVVKKNYFNLVQFLCTKGENELLMMKNEEKISSESEDILFFTLASNTPLDIACEKNFKEIAQYLKANKFYLQMYNESEESNVNRKL